MSALCEDAARLAELYTLQFDCSDNKVLPAQLIQVYSDRDQVPSWFMRRQRKARCVRKCLDVFEFDERQLIVRRFSVPTVRVPITPQAAVLKRLDLSKRDHGVAARRSYENVPNCSHVWIGRLLPGATEKAAQRLRRLFERLFRKEVSGLDRMTFNILAPGTPNGERSAIVDIPSIKCSFSTPECQ